MSKEIPGNGIPEPTTNDLARIEKELQSKPLNDMGFPNEAEHDDLFRQYVNSLPKVAPKSLEESLALGKRVKDGGPDAKEAREELFFSCARMVISVARKRKARGTNTSFMDLIEEGNEGLWMAAEKYDYQRGVKFSTYSMWYIEQKIKKSGMEDAGTIKIPQGVAYLVNRVAKARGDLTNEKGEAPSIREVAKRVGLSPGRVEALLEYHELKSIGSINAHTENGEDADEHGDFIEDENSLYRDGLDGKVDLAILKKVCDGLPLELTSKQRKAIVFRYEFGLTYDEIGQIMKISVPAVKALEDKALRHLRIPQVKSKLEPFLEERPTKNK
ncbi:MAG: RNA polymerase sigma factor [Candidatus Woesebacteria bacterium GW2011_GWB1_45_5]|uniref:RNA polymerase sigma factor n=1 Tax=Candidatus Woesebacteria bacterium GW2011_GWB1_45_5 TaxID=1618581 RepID=A0A0G1MQJ5_9BACT|nr:MAG: RNA polymerase sigma factor [Candidatus Woesebacteria bacterium GW2011_GWB1_45_5]